MEESNPADMMDLNSTNDGMTLDNDPLFDDNEFIIFNEENQTSKDLSSWIEDEKDDLLSFNWSKINHSGINSLSISGNNSNDFQKIQIPCTNICLNIPEMNQFSNIGILSQALIIRQLICHLHLRQALFDLFRMRMYQIVQKKDDELTDDENQPNQNQNWIQQEQQQEINSFYSANHQLNEATKREILSILLKKREKAKNIKLNERENIIVMNYLLSHPSLKKQLFEKEPCHEMEEINIQPIRKYCLLRKRMTKLIDYCLNKIPRPSWIPKEIPVETIRLKLNQFPNVLLSSSDPQSSPILHSFEK